VILLDTRGCWRVVASNSISIIDSVDLVILGAGGPVIVRAALRNGNELTDEGQESLLRHGLIGDFFDSPAADWYLDTDDDAVEEREILDIVEESARSSARPVLDVCCGRGRLSAPLLGRGLEVHGVDLSAVSVERAEARAASEGHHASFHSYIADVANFGRPGFFGAAICAANSLRYLGSRTRIARHLELMASSLVAGGIYAVEIDTRPLPGGGTWKIPRGELTWEIISVDTFAGESLERVVVKDHGGNIVAEEMQAQVALSASDLISLSESCGLQTRQIFDPKFNALDLSEIETYAGNLWYILQRQSM
jgi:SAM-dependent methyltransferase